MNHQIALNRAVLLTAMIATLFFMPSLLDPFNMPKLVIIVIGAGISLGLLLGFVRDWWDKALLPLLLVVAVFLGSLIAAGVASPQSWYRTVFGAWSRNNGALVYAALAVLLLVMAMATRGAPLAQRTLNAMVWLGGIQAGYALIQTTGNDPVPWNNPYNPIIGTVGNPNFASALMSLCTIATVQGVLDARNSRVRRITYSTLALLQLAMIYRSDAQQGILAFAIGMIVLGAAWLTLQQGNWVKSALIAWYTAAVIGTTVTVFGLTNRGPLAPIVFQDSLRRRWDYWDTAWRMLQDKPIFGVGIDSYGDWFRFYRSPVQVNRGEAGWNVVSNNAHNVALQLGATGGLVLMLAYVLLMLFVAWRATALLRSGHNRLMAGGVVGAWVAFQVQSLVSIDQLGLTVWGWVIAGTVVGLSYARRPTTVSSGNGPSPKAKSTPSGPRPRQTDAFATLSRYTVPALAAAGVIGIAATSFTAPRLNADSAVRQVISIGVDNQSQEQVTQVADQIYTTTLDSPEPHWQIVSIVRLYEIGAVSQGIQLAQAATTRFPNEVDLWNLLASAYESNQLWTEAVATRKKSVELDPLNGDFTTKLSTAVSAIEGNRPDSALPEFSD